MTNKFDWSIDHFLDCYNSIKYEGTVNRSLLSAIKHDLISVLITPKKDESKLPEEVEFSNGTKYKLNTEFMEAATVLSSELQLNVVNTAELLQLATFIGFQSGTDFTDSGRVAFYTRFQYILNIVGYLVSTKQLDLITSDYQAFFDNLLESFKTVYTRLSTLNDLLEKEKVAGDINRLKFVNASRYTKSENFQLHELLGGIYYGLISNYGDKLATTSNYDKVVAVITSSLKDEDTFTVHFLPGLLKFLTSFDGKSASDGQPTALVSDSQIELFHKSITTKLTQDYQNLKVCGGNSSDEEVDLSKSTLHPLEILLALVGLTSFVSWCKQDDARTAKYSFKDDILKYIEWCITYGAFEKLLCIAADTSASPTATSPFIYDFRALLQKTFPALSPLKLTYPGTVELLNIASNRPDLLSNIPSLVQTSQFEVGSDFKNELIGPLLHIFFKQFISNNAIILTSLRDSEEDFLLSSATRKEEEREEELKRRRESDSNDTKDNENNKNSIASINGGSSGANSSTSGSESSIDLDEISSRSELERFYLAFAYTHRDRPDICALIWNDEANLSELLGFIGWGLTNNTSPLITATFSILVGSITFGGEDASIKVWDVLVNNNFGPTSTSSVLKKSDFSKISVDSISESLYYYIDMLNKNFKEDLQYQQQQQRHMLQDILLPGGSASAIYGSSSGSSSTKGVTDDSETITPIEIELAEDSVVFITGFMQLLTDIVKNLSSTSSNEQNLKETKTTIFNRFHPVVVEFLKFDNLITSTKALSNGNGPAIYISEDNRVILINLILDFLGAFVDEDLNLRYKIWDTIDRWVFNGGWPVEADKQQQAGSTSNDSSSPINGSGYKSVKIVQYFQSTLRQLSLVTKFVQLVSKLLHPTNNDVKAFRKYKLLYPADLGNEYRNIGVWPYIEFILVEVFAKSGNLQDQHEKNILQLSITELILKSIKEIDWVFLLDTAPNTVKNLNLDQCVEGELGANITFEIFIKLHHSLAILNYLFNESVYKVIFQILQRGEEEENEGLAITLSIVEQVLDIQNTFINGLIPILKNKDNIARNEKSNLHNNDFVGYGTNMSIILSTPRSVWDNIYYPKSLGLQGITNFDEIFVFNLPIVAKFGIYIGSFYSTISTSSINILNHISQSNFFGTSNQTITKNRLLTTFESVNESERIKYAFIRQLEREVDNEEELKTQFKILEFLRNNIDENGINPSLTHFLLGYEIRGRMLHLEEDSTNNTLLRTILSLLNSSLNSISNIDYNKGNIHVIDLAPSKLSALILEILVRLCSDKISSYVTLSYLRNDMGAPEDSLFTKLIKCQPNIDLSSVWSSRKFDGDLQPKYNNLFIEETNCIATIFAFIRHRNLLLQYFSLEFHNTTKQRSITRRDYYIKLLLNDNEFLNGSPRVLSFLDILNFRFDNIDVSKYDKYDNKYNLDMILRYIKNEPNGSDISLVDLSIMEKIFKVICKSNHFHDKQQKIAFAQEMMNEGGKVAEFLTKYVTYNDFRGAQLACLHSWVQLIHVLLTDGKMTTPEKSNFILETFQVILPKINDYLDIDILFAEELISLSVILFEFYERENIYRGDTLSPLFQTCINGILSSYSTPDLRSDLYVLANKFLQKSFANEDILKDLTITIKSVDRKLVDILCNDSIYAEGSPRITSLILLESLVHLSSLNRVNFVLETIIKNNSLSLLIRSLKRTDEILNDSAANGGFSLNNLLYELTAFKSTLYLLLRISTTTSGASQLIQCELFPIIRSSKFLQIDPDLGLNLRIESSEKSTPEGNSNSSSTEVFSVHLSLDTPLSLSDNDSITSSNDISYFEFLVPIFQLITGILVSMGPSYKPTIYEGKELMKHFHQLIVGVLKRDALIEQKSVNSKKFAKVYAADSVSYIGLKELVNLIVLLDSLVSDKKE